MNDLTQMTALQQSMQGCSVCTNLQPSSNTLCARCGSTLHHPEHTNFNNSLQRTSAWLITSMILYIPANFLPIMVTNVLGTTTQNTIIGGVLTLLQLGSYPIAFIIFVASVVVPLGKIFVLIGLCLAVRSHSVVSRKQKVTLYRLTELVGRWSMIDVFVVGILVALVQLKPLMSIHPGNASLAFAAMVVTTMIAAMSFDPRLLWRSETPLETVEPVHD